MITSQRSNKPPWITNRIRRLGKKKKKCRILKKKGPLWWSTDKIMQKEIANSRQEYIDKVLKDGNSGKSFYAVGTRRALEMVCWRPIPRR